MSDDSAMGDYEMDLIRHIVGKALVESDEIDIKKMSHAEIETALWGMAGAVSHGIHITHPDTRPIYKSKVEDNE